MRSLLWFFIILHCFVVHLTSSIASETRVGSKAFTESVILGEIVAQMIKHSGADAVHYRQLGGTRILWEALKAGEIDVYPEYTGTLSNEILVGEQLESDEERIDYLDSIGIGLGGVLGFNNTYAIAVLESTAKQLGIRNLSDLAKYPRLSFGFSNEFMSRRDGWPGLRFEYSLPQERVFGLDHDLAYRGLVAEDIDATDVYSTDAEIEYYALSVLEDDRQYFPVYNAVLVYRKDWMADNPELKQILRILEGSIQERQMSAMNAEVKLARRTEADVAAEFVSKEFKKQSRVPREERSLEIWANTLDHLQLVGISLLAAIVIAIPLGIVAAWYSSWGHLILMVVGVVQTVPSLAMFVFMIPLVGIGGPPAILALFLYSLLPIVRNTHAGLKNIPSDIIEAADSMGLPPGIRLRIVELPMAAKTILAGIKTSAVINVGTATLGALIGAGGYGQPILTGIRLDDVGLILSGAVPAAVLALLVQGCFGLGERYMTQKGLRQ